MGCCNSKEAKIPHQNPLERADEAKFPAAQQQNNAPLQKLPQEPDRPKKAKNQKFELKFFNTMKPCA